MIELILFLTLCVILRFMFHTFGFLPDKDEKRKDEAINNFVNKISGGSNSMKNNTESSDNEKGFFESIFKSYENYKKKLKNVNDKENSKANNKENTISRLNNEKEDQIDNFEEEIFKKTAEKAVVIILDSFTKKNFLALKDMLTEDMYEMFSKNIKEAEEKKYNYKTVIVSFDEINIIEKNINYKEQSITLNFKMKQINYVEDENENVISGSKNKVDIVVENWTFVKNSSSKFWLLKSVN